MYNSLYHHGILGQRWGKKNGPPYPLDGEDHSQSEKKAGWKKSLGGSGSGSSDKQKQKAAKKERKQKVKEAKKQYNRKKRIEMINAAVNYGGEFDETPEGKKLYAEYAKQYKYYFDTPGVTDDGLSNEEIDKFWEPFYKAEEAYLRKRNEYEANKLLEKYGNELVSLYATDGWRATMTGEEAVKAISDEWWVHAV